MRETLLGLLVGLAMGAFLIHHASPDFFTEKHRVYLHESVFAD